MFNLIYKMQMFSPALWLEESEKSSQGPKVDQNNDKPLVRKRMWHFLGSL